MPTSQKLPIISIVGSTATGKTDLALFMAEKIITDGIVSGVNIISADSRQVYQGLEITTGADIPENFERIKKQNRDEHSYSYFADQYHNINLHGISIIKPNQDWSLAHFVKMAQIIIEQSIQDNYLVIVVGGTGLYHTKLLDDNLQIEIKPDQKIRKKAQKMSVAELQNWLKEINSKKLSQMNQSDINNPRRLVRAIEISLHQNISQTKTQQLAFKKIKQLTIGLKIDLEILKEKIKSRVEKRWQQDSLKEVKTILKHFPQPNLPALSATGVKEIASFLNQEIDQKECLELWALHEYQYAKRQITWWKKYPQIEWFEAIDEQLFKKIKIWIKKNSKYFSTT